jgi:hypothetical protein
MKKGSLWVLIVVMVFGLMLATGCQKKEAPSEQPAVTESATPPAAPEAAPSTATTGGAAAPAAPAPTGSAQ